MIERLSDGTLPRVHGALVPTYDRSAPRSIVHLGVGAFARAHLAVFADDLLASGWPAAIHGVSLRSPSAEELLGPQDGLFTVVEREPHGAAAPRVVGSITRVSTGPDHAIGAVAAGTTRFVTLTITEQGYAEGPAFATIAAGLDGHRRRGAAPPVVASLDNLLHNGDVLRAGVLAAADRIDPALAGWIAEHVPFPRSVVDRMVPATTSSDLDELAEAIGVLDLAAVTAERHRSWVLEDVEGLPPLADVGVQVVGDVDPYQRRKLWLLNGPHSATAYAGLLVGAGTIAEAAIHPAVAAFVHRLVDDVLEVADVPDGPAYAAEALARFRNPALGHTCRQVGTDGSRKLPERLLPVVAERRRRGLATDRLALVVAMWFAAATGMLESVVDDPAPALPETDPGFDAEVRAALERLVREGPAALEDRR